MWTALLSTGKNTTLQVCFSNRWVRSLSSIAVWLNVLLLCTEACWLHCTALHCSWPDCHSVFNLTELSNVKTSAVFGLGTTQGHCTVVWCGVVWRVSAVRMVYCMIVVNYVCNSNIIKRVLVLYL